MQLYAITTSKTTVIALQCLELTGCVGNTNLGNCLLIFCGGRNELSCTGELSHITVHQFKGFEHGIFQREGVAYIVTKESSGEATQWRNESAGVAYIVVSAELLLHHVYVLHTICWLCLFSPEDAAGAHLRIVSAACTVGHVVRCVLHASTKYERLSQR